MDGLRIDHPDGLADPAGYLQRLRERRRRARLGGEDPRPRRAAARLAGRRAPSATSSSTTSAALFVDPAGEAPLTDLWVEVSGDDRRFGELAFEAKLEQARTTFAPEVERLLRDAPERVAGLERALASLPRLPHLRRAVVGTRRRRGPRRRSPRPACRPRSRRVLALEAPGWDAFVTRFQQTTPPVMAKGVEDTAFYRYARLLALNDVGGDPGRFSVSVARLPRAATRERAERFPRNLLVTQTHDTKRSGDVRARIGALAGDAGRVRGARAHVAVASAAR